MAPSDRSAPVGGASPPARHASPRSSEEIGRVLGGRYRILAVIGRGASAQVFLADDVRLRRRVAVKMLHAALADDAKFLRRFRAEAQAAAALNHPHVMAVYDWGQEADAPYLVLEYLGGGSLRAMLDVGHRLSPAQALQVGLEASGALDYAHRRGLVHRDVKPANLLFGDDGRLRIADFGLARALAEAAWTEPQGAVLGTARYASPEQAQGEPVTGRGDVYSLALVLVEAVTGRVPFTTDTTLGTLMARVDRPLVVPDELGPLRPALERAGCPDPEERLDANGLGTALMAAADQLDPPEPLALVGTVGGGGLGPDGDPTELGSADDDGPRPSEDHDLDVPAFVAAGAASTAAAAAAAGSDGTGQPEDGPDGLAGPLVDLRDSEASGAPSGAGTTVVVDRAHAPSRATATGRPTAAAAAVETRRAPAPFEPGRRSRFRPRRRWPLVAAVVLMLLVGAGAGGFALVSDPESTSTPRPAPTPTSTPATPTVPEVVGLPVDAAQRNLTALGWTVETTAERRDGSERGEVLAVRPQEGVDLAKGEEVVLVVSAGQTMRPVPVDQLRGKPVDVAADVLAFAGLDQGEVTQRFHDDVADGAVIDVTPGTPAELERGSTVGLVVSQGPEPRVVPAGLVGLPAEEAAARLGSMGLEVTAVDAFSDTVPDGSVIGTDPAAGAEVARGSSVTLRVSGGAAPVTVPSDVVGRPADEASGRLDALGLQVEVVDAESDTVPQGRVIGTDPAAGSEVAPGSTVILRVSRGSGLIPVPDGLAGLPADEATDRLKEIGLLVDTKGNWSDTVPRGTVIETEPGPGFEAEPGAVVILDISLGPRPVAVPDVSQAATLDEAILIIRGAGLEPGLLQGNPAGHPVATDPPVGTEVPKGTAVDIIVL